MNIDIGPLADYVSWDVKHKYDLPFYYIRRQKLNGEFLDIGFPQLFKWEIQCILGSNQRKINLYQLELLNNKLIKYLDINPTRSIKGRSTFTTIQDILNRTIWYKSEYKELKIWRILKCSQIIDEDNVIFSDVKHGDFQELKIQFSRNQLKKRGFIYVGR